MQQCYYYTVVHLSLGERSRVVELENRTTTSPPSLVRPTSLLRSTGCNNNAAMHVVMPQDLGGSSHFCACFILSVAKCHGGNKPENSNNRGCTIGITMHSVPCLTYRYVGLRARKRPLRSSSAISFCANLGMSIARRTS